MADELQIVYGSFTAGGSSAYPLDKVYTLSEGYEAGSFECTVCVESTTEAGFATACQAVEAAFRQPRQDLTVTLGSTTLLSRTHSNTTQTALDTSPTATKLEEGATGRTRKYAIRIEYGMPADNVSTSGRRNSQMEIAADNAKRQSVTFTGVYTATAGNTATANYLANIDTFCNARLLSILNLTTGTDIELVEETFTPNDTNKTCDFRRVYLEVRFAQAGTLVSPFDQTRFVNQNFKVSIEYEAPGDSPLYPGKTAVDTAGSAAGTVVRWRRLVASFSCAVDFEQSQQLDTLWRTVVLPWIVQQINTITDGRPFIMTRQGREPTYDTNSLTGRVEGWVTTGSVHEAEVKFEDMYDTGEKLVAAWKKDDPFAYYKYQGPAVLVRTVHERYLSTSPDFPQADAPWGVGAHPKAEGKSALVTPVKTTATPKTIGFAGGAITGGATVQTVLDYELERVTTVQFYNALPAPGSFSSGFGGSTIPGGPTINDPPSSGGSGSGGNLSFTFN